MTAVQQQTTELVVTIEYDPTFGRGSTSVRLLKWRWRVTDGPVVIAEDYTYSRISARCQSWRFCRNWARHGDHVETWRFTREPAA